MRKVYNLVYIRFSSISSIQVAEILYYQFHLKDSLKKVYVNILCFFCSFNYRGKTITKGVNNIIGIVYGITIIKASACNIIKISCEFREIFKNTFFTEQLWTTASVNLASKFGIIDITLEASFCLLHFDFANKIW